MHNDLIYLDYASTTPVDLEVLGYMLPYFTDRYGNASSRQHRYGWEASAAVEIARANVAALIGAHKEEIIFTSGATESVNLALRGVFDAYQSKGKHFITCLTEHPAVLDTFKALELHGACVTYLEVDEHGLIDVTMLRDQINDDTILVALMASNNETGVLQSLHEISAACREKNVLFFTDATQAVGKIPFDVNEIGVDLAAVSAHKFYGPKGCGALYVRKKGPRVSLIATQTGGGQEKDLRSGTLNVPGIAGMGKAAEIASKSITEDSLRIKALRDRLERKLASAIRGYSINGAIDKRLYSISNCVIPGIRASELMTSCPGLAIAAGSACASANPAPSHVLTAMHKSETVVASSIRISLGRQTTEAEIDSAVFQLTAAYRAISF